MLTHEKLETLRRRLRQSNLGVTVARLLVIVIIGCTGPRTVIDIEGSGGAQTLQSPAPVALCLLDVLLLHPDDVVLVGSGVLQAQVLVPAPCLVDTRDILEHQPNAPPIQQDVVKRPQQLISIRGSADEREPHGWCVRKPEALGTLLAQERIQPVLSLHQGECAPIEALQ